MRPYTLHKDQDGKYIQPNITQLNVIQPSPLALLAATCSKIGQTVPEDARSYSQGKAGGVGLTRSCSEQLKSSPFVYLDRSSDSLKASPPITPAVFHSPYFKVKQEESADYNQNYEGVHICPSVFRESRLLETQKEPATSSCGHRARGYAASCEHVVENHEFFTANNAPSSCDQSPRYTRLRSHDQHNLGASFAVDQFGMPDQGFFGQGSHASSCAYESQVFQGSALANLSAIAPTCSMPDFDTSLPTGFSSQGEKDVDMTSSWSHSLRDIRDGEIPVSSKPSCLMSDRSPHLRHMPPESQISTPHHGLSHVNAPVQPPLEATTTGICQQQFFSQLSFSPAQDSMTSSQNFHGPLSSQHIHPYPGYPPRPGEDKFNSYIQHPHPNFRTTPPVNVGTMHPSVPLHTDSMYQCHSPNDQRLKWRYPQQLLPGIVRQHPSPTSQVNLMADDAVNLRMHGSGNPMQMGDYCSSNGSSPSSSMQLPSPSVPPCGIGASHPGEVQDQALSEYQYQQQQMFYARDNRRPRRIACTCPNCRDGDNKSVTTKDGKQRKLHVCHVPDCGKIYGKTSHLRAHLRWHAGERPFACNWLFCNKRFTRSDELQRHRRTHTGDKRFQCRTCLKKFMRSDHLSKHMKTHLLQQKASKIKDDPDSASDAVSASSDDSESCDLGTQLKEILNDSPFPTTSE